MMYKTTAEYDAAIQKTQNAIARQLDYGNSYSLDSGNITRSNTEVRLTSLRSHLRTLQQEKDILAGGPGGGFMIRAGW